MSLKAIRPLAPRDPSEPHRASTTLELLFDLVSVIAIAAVTAGLHHAISGGHGLEALPRFVFVFLAIWWAWMNFTWFASAFDNDDALYRVLVLVIIAGELIFAGGVGFIFDTLDFHVGLAGWTIMRLGMIGLWLRAAAGSPAHRTTALRYAAGIALAQTGWVVMYLLADPQSLWFYAFAAAGYALELAVPPFAESAGATPYHRHHVIERYGLLMIITLGEIMLSISRGYGLLFATVPAIPAATAATAALVIVFSIWWIYFCEQEHLPHLGFKTALVWGYGHVFIFAATALAGAAIGAGIDLAAGESHASRSEVALWLGLALAMIYGFLWIVRDRHLPLDAARRLSLPSMAVVFALAGFAGLPGWAFATLSGLAVAWRAPVTGRGASAGEHSGS